VNLPINSSLSVTLDTADLRTVSGWEAQVVVRDLRIDLLVGARDLVVLVCTRGSLVVLDRLFCVGTDGSGVSDISERAKSRQAS
jgi:hypothetical protein